MEKGGGVGAVGPLHGLPVKEESMHLEELMRLEQCQARRSSHALPAVVSLHALSSPGQGHNGAGEAEVCGRWRCYERNMVERRRDSSPREAGQAVLAQAAQLCDFVHPCSAASCQARKTKAHLSSQPPHSSRHFPVRSSSVLTSQVSVARNWTALCLGFPIFKMGIIDPAWA